MGLRVTLTDRQVAAVRRLWRAGATQAEIAQEIGVKLDALRARMRDQLRDLPPRPRTSNSGRRGVEPTESEIEAMCRAMRAAWTEDERIAHL